MFNSENTCYLKVVRPPTKTAHHFFSGRCEIQRVSLLSDHDSLEYSIRHSKMLESYKEKYPFSRPFQKGQLNSIFTIKGIAEDQNKFYISKILRELHCYQYTLHTLETKRKTKYDRNNAEHETKLLGLWQNLKPSEKLSSRVSEQWICIGFQVSDPATDFRGAGELGLQNLYQFSGNQKCKEVFKIASSPQTEYFFCSAGLFFTMLCLEILKLKTLDYHFWINESQAQLFNNFQVLYETLFCQFSKFWINDCQNKTIMYFNQNLKNFQISVKKWNGFEFKSKIMQHKN